MGRVNFYSFFFLWKGEMKSTGRKRKGEGYFSISYGGVPLRVSILKENTKETYIRFLLFFISYLAGRCLLSSAKGASLRCWKKRGIPGKCKETGARRLWKNDCGWDAYGAVPMFDIRRCESKEELAFISGITRVSRGYHLMELGP